MILRDLPRPWQLFLVMRGSVVPRIAPMILIALVWALAVLLVDHHMTPLPRLSVPAMGVFGLALSLFLGFRNNAAYDRWWEGRRIWGGMVSDLRSFAQELDVFGASEEDRRFILTHILAFHHLHRRQLRGDQVEEDVRKWVDDGADALLSADGPDAALRAVSNRLSMMRTAGRIDGFGARHLAERLAGFAVAQAGNERLLTTPVPFVYSLLVQRTAYLYCVLLPFGLLDSAGWFEPVICAVVAYVFFGLSEVSHELERPFADAPNALPLSALCRVMERSVCHALGWPAPPPAEQVDGVLS